MFLRPSARTSDTAFTEPYALAYSEQRGDARINVLATPATLNGAADDRVPRMAAPVIVGGDVEALGEWLREHTPERECAAAAAGTVRFPNHPFLGNQQ